MTKPNIGRPYRWKGQRLLIVPEVGDRDNQCKGCLREEEESTEFFALCEVRGDKDCSNAEDDQEHRPNHIFIRDTKASIVEYIARRIEG